MKTCKVKPSVGACHCCYETAESYSGVPDCKNCSNERYELIEISSNFWGDYAYVQANGKIKKVSLDRVYDIQEKE